MNFDDVGMSVYQTQSAAFVFDASCLVFRATLHVNNFAINQSINELSTLSV